jgi:hypothetical protein
VSLADGRSVQRLRDLRIRVRVIFSKDDESTVREPGRKRAVVVGLLAGVTILVHPGATVFVALSAGLMWLFEGRSIRSLVYADVAVGLDGRSGLHPGLRRPRRDDLQRRRPRVSVAVVGHRNCCRDDHMPERTKARATRSIGR